MYKIGIITWHHYNNFGSALQAFALQYFLNEMGYDTININYIKRCSKLEKYKDIVRIFLKNTFGGKRYRLEKRYLFDDFRKKNIKLTKEINSFKELSSMSSMFDIIICGSDQIWAPNVYNPIYFLSFVSGLSKKISYAASIGLDYIPNQLIDIYKFHLKTFDAISVREKKGQELLKELCDIEGEVVLDPTFLIDVEVYKGISDNKKYTSKEYAFCYFLNDSHSYRSLVTEYIKKHNLEAIGVSHDIRDNEWMNVINNMGPSQFLGCIEQASIIFTDSYHGTIFSMLYHKKFITFERFTSNNIICQNSRIYQLCDMFGIYNHIINVNTTEQLIIPEINYIEIDKKILELKEFSKKFLRDAIEC